MNKKKKKIVFNKRKGVQINKNQQLFLASVIHELRTPLNGIIGMSSLLKLTPVSDEQKEYIDGIMESSNNMLIIINDILDIYKANAGKIVFEERPFSIRDVINNIALSMKESVIKKGIYFTVNIDPEIPAKVIGDGVRLSQIFWNLAGNAVKFTDKGGVNVNITPDNETTNRIKFAIKDTGIGIEKEKLNIIFEPYIQVDTSVQNKMGSTGLGLGIAKKLTELQGGSIKAESTIGGGSLFTFVLPFKTYSTEPEISNIEYKHLPGKSIKVLIAEDNLINRKVIVKLLSKWSIETDVASNGKNVIEMLSSMSFDVILMDLQMPEMDGFETSIYIRNKMSPPASTTPIIALTAAAVPGERERCLARGMNDYLPKPLEPHKLRNAIEQLLKNRT